MKIVRHVIIFNLIDFHINFHKTKCNLRTRSRKYFQNYFLHKIKQFMELNFNFPIVSNRLYRVTILLYT